MSRPEYIEVEDNVNLHVVDYGEGPTVVFVHGWPLSNAMFEYQYSTLARQGLRVVGISLRGYGLSDKPYGDYSYDRHADDLKCVFEQIAIVEDAVLCGFSMGGAVALHYAVKYEGCHITRLALAGAALPVWTRRDGFDAGHKLSEVNDFIELNNTNRPELFKEFGKIFPAEESALPAGIADWLNTIHLQSSGYATEQGLIALRDTDLREAVEMVSMPTLILHGKKDKICPFAFAEYIHEHIPESELVSFENSGHALFYEELDKFNEEIVRFAKSEVEQTVE